MEAFKGEQDVTSVDINLCDLGVTRMLLDSVGVRPERSKIATTSSKLPSVMYDMHIPLHLLLPTPPETAEEPEGAATFSHPAL